MALVRYGGGIVQMSGSIAGDTFARNRYGNYSRARTKPVNPNSSGQQAVRAALAQLTTRWGQTLTAVQRTAWNLYGSNVAMKNRLGETINLTGFNHYIRSNSNLIRAGESIVDDGPTIFELPEVDGTIAITASEATQQYSISFDDTLAWANETGAFIFVFQGMPQNPQRNFFNGPWFYRGHIDGDDGVPPVSPSVHAVTFAIAEGQHLWMYFRVLRADGRISEPFRDDTFCAA